VLCDEQALVLTGEELDPELRLQCLDLMAHGALRDAQLLGRAREAFVPRRGLESLEGVERRQPAQHRFAIRKAKAC